MAARDISRRAALTTLLATHVPRDTEIKVWPIENTTDGPATLHKTLEHIGRDTVTAILIDSGILTVKKCRLTLKHRDSLLSSTVIMTAFLADNSPIEVDTRSTTIKGSRSIFWTIQDRKASVRRKRRSSLASPDSSMSTFDSFDDSYIKDVLAKYKNLRAAPENSPSPQSQGCDKDSKPKREVAKTVQKVGKESSAFMSNNYQPISKKKFNGMERMRIEKNGEISTLEAELMECRQTIESLNEQVRAYDSLRRENAVLGDKSRHLENKNRKLLESIKTTTDALAALQATIDTTTNTDAEVIGRLILDKMESASHCPMTPKGQSLYMTAMSEVPKASAYALATSIPCIVAAFLADCGVIDADVVGDIAGKISKLCPSKWSLQAINRSSREFSYQKIAEIIDQCIPIHLAHDKGLRNGLARLIIELSYRNPVTGLPGSIRIGCEGSHGSSEEVAKSIKHTLDNIARYCKPGVAPSVASYSTDSGGGGVGKSVVDASKELGFIHEEVMTWASCIMHALNRALQVATVAEFTAGQRNENDAGGLFIWNSVVKGRVRELIQEVAKGTRKRNNQHVLNGVAISPSAKKNEAKRRKTGTDAFFRVQPTPSNVAATLIRETMENFVQSEEQIKATKTVLKFKKSEQFVSKKDERLDQSKVKLNAKLDSNEAKKAAGKKHRDVDKIKMIPVDLPDSQKSTIRVNKLVCAKNRKYLELELDTRDIFYELPTQLKKNGEPMKVQKTRTLTELKVMMLRYELKERENSEEMMLNGEKKKFDEMNVKELGEAMKMTSQGDELKLLHDNHKGNLLRNVIETILKNTMTVK